ncbi:4'-phosphopantetheinyl transferase superfamily protein [Kitasatospora sp. NBC_01287]|uniref:4'-phosphopantetheinyl transferase family protein n=1 Tax=Kitasatospora sp. NBC_01287 TaxID=2903573 RepID=UPI00224FBD24|nr:4'-phosphopantetheinyl transferase superfamily protein [Kitasatospora sp. NBC_01287]MCX4744837.1 4'-phosphopantetheinyl transferase superfamily protein [Kitasatospora sp. NBC_01287]
MARVDGQERAAARELALRLVAGRVGVAVDRLRLGRAVSGQPVVEGASGVAVSISHVRGVVAVAAGTGVGGVGVDVERIRPVAHEALARRWFPAAEAAWIAGREPAERSAAFLWLWTQKEALAKARGQGLGGGKGLLRPVALPERWPPGPSFSLSSAVAWPVTEELMLAVAVRGVASSALDVLLLGGP